MVISACGTAENKTDGTSEEKTSAGQTETVNSTELTAASEISVPEVTWAEEAVQGSEQIDADYTITFNDTSISCDQTDDAVSIDGSTVTITKAGSYLISGRLSDGQLIVDTDDEEKVKLYFDGVDIYCSDSAPVNVVNASKKVVIYLTEGSVNLISDGEEYSSDDEDAPTAAVYSKEDLKLDGSGELYVTANYNKGIVSKDDLEIEGGSIYISAVDDGVRGKDSVTMTGGLLYIVAGGDGLRTSNEEEDDKGWIDISGGELYITSGQDGIQAITDLNISGGIFAINSGGGSSNSSSSNENWGSWGTEALPEDIPGGGMAPNGGMSGAGPGSASGASATADSAINTAYAAEGNTAESTENESGTDESTSAKALKAGDVLSISGGSINIDSSDDAVHSNDTAEISGGDLYIASGDDGMHADEVLQISGGEIKIIQSYEGLEALDIQISGGDIDVLASDDGINAAGGSDGSSLDRMGANSFGEGEGSLTISGGRIVINAEGDGLDSNGTIDMSDGTVIVYGPTRGGNGALDCVGGFTLTGGWLLAVGDSGMAESVNDSEQGVIFCSVEMSADEVLQICSADGEEIAAIAAPKAYNSIVFTSPEIESGESYVLYSGAECSGEITDGICEANTCSGGTELGSITAD